MGQAKQSYRLKTLITRARNAQYGHRDGLDLHKTEVRLLRLQTWANWATVLSTVLLSLALLTLTYFQWRTADSTAAIERAKSRPHFRIEQENTGGPGFVPGRFAVVPEAGISDATQANATLIMDLHYNSRALGLAGTCRASSPDFYRWSGDAMTFDLDGPSGDFIVESHHIFADSFVVVQPLWLLVDISYVDIFGVQGRQNLMLFGGRPLTISEADFRANARSDMTLGRIVPDPIHQKLDIIGVDVTSRGCREALRVIDRTSWLRVNRSTGQLPSPLPSYMRAVPFTREIPRGIDPRQPRNFQPYRPEGGFVFDENPRPRGGAR